MKVKNNRSDFWNELTSEEQSEINQAIRELDNGEGADWNEFKRSLTSIKSTQ